MHFTDGGTVEINSVPFNINNFCNPNRTDMEQFNCKRLNEVFNIDGLDYILIQDVKEEFNSISTFNLNHKKGKGIRDVIKSKAEILKISKSNTENIIYQKEKIKDNTIDSINKWIDNTCNELLKQQNNLITHLDWKNTQIKKLEKLPLNEYKKVRESFIDFISSIDRELEEKLCQNRVIKNKSNNQINLEKREENIMMQIKHQKKNLKKDKNIPDFSKYKV